MVENFYLETHMRCARPNAPQGMNFMKKILDTDFQRYLKV